MLERQNMELVRSLREEQDKLEEQEMKYKKQLEEVSSEHSNNLTQMRFLLANQKKVSSTLNIVNVTLSICSFIQMAVLSTDW